MSNVSSDLVAHLLRSGGKNVKSHLIHLDCGSEFLLIVVDVSHVNSDSSSKTVLLSLYDLVVFCQSLLKHSSCL